MYCQTCDCEYSGWTYRCPVCKSLLQERKSVPSVDPAQAMPYEELIERVRRTGGLEIDLHTSQVRKNKKMRFPYRGFGFAWASQLRGEQDGLTVELFTTRAEKNTAWSFPYFGYGFAWEQEMEGQVQGLDLMLKASKVKRERRQRFPYRGYGFAWTEELVGECGSGLEALFKTSEVDRSRGYQFPYFGFGYAWIAAGKLSLRLIE